MVKISLWTFSVLCTGVLGLDNRDAYHVASPATSTLSQPGCPSPIGLVNGGFESGKLAPWTLLSNSDQNVKQSVVSPGFDSNHALQVNITPTSSVSEYSLAQSTTGKECFGYYYNISYSWNWKDYTGPVGKGPSYCAFSVSAAYSEDNVPLHYGSTTPGWHHNSYISRDIYSHCKPLATEYIADVTCVGANNAVLPPFTILIDQLQIHDAPGDPNPPPACS